MNILKALFGGAEESPEEKKKAEETRRFEMFKYDGVKAAKMGQTEYAVRCYREALAIREDLEVRDFLAQALIRMGELDGAREQLQVLAAAEPDNLDIALLEARVAYMQGDYETMAAICGRAMEYHKDSAAVYYFCAKAHIGQGNTVVAVAMLTRAIALNPDLNEALLLRGNTLLGMGDTAGASGDVARLMETAADNEDVLMLAARVERAKGNAGAAIELYGRVIEVSPFNVDALHERGAIKYEQGDLEGAKKDMQEVFEIDPLQLTDISGDYSSKDVEHKVSQADSNINPLGL